MTKLALIGEAWGEEEERQRLPFVGASGYELTRMLDEAGIHRADCFLTNVFNLRPRSNKIEDLCGPKTEALPGFPALVKGKYIRAEFKPELERLGEELADVNPNLIVALGNTPLWALSGSTGISKARGTTRTTTHTVSGFKLLSTYHPAAVLRQWELRPIAVADFMKAKREAEYPEIRRPKRLIHIEPTLEDLYAFRRDHISSFLSVDIETSGAQITCIGLAPTKDVALVIPFVVRGRKGRSYWDSQHTEVQVWTYIRQLLGDRSIRKVFQNGLYDIAFLWRAYGIQVMGAEHDTMLLHHALQPESLKGLGFLGSIYCDEGNWKQMRKVETIKGDD